eukprot:TRINITY_DN26436_c0_g1_i1.p1 TRINITY_DN26436_c0_g1~~TRINITY_DN26436_c0_g1_i1.p1  ORF type:complete len:434 (-),score=56.10 TRINITY_DN26436_c0_g1_i1:52-1353(-)
MVTDLSLDSSSMTLLSFLGVCVTWLDPFSCVKLASASRELRSLCTSARGRHVVPLVQIPKKHGEYTLNASMAWLRLLQILEPAEVVAFEVYASDWNIVNSWMSWIAGALAAPSCKCKQLKLITQMDYDDMEYPSDDSSDEEAHVHNTIPCNALVQEHIISALFGALHRNCSLETLVVLNLQGWLWWLTDELCWLLRKSLPSIAELRTLKLDVSVESEDGFVTICDGIAGCKKLKKLKLKGPATLPGRLTLRSCRAIGDMVQAITLDKITLMALPDLGRYMHRSHAMSAICSVETVSLKFLGFTSCFLDALAEGLPGSAVRKLSLKEHIEDPAGTWQVFLQTVLSRMKYMPLQSLKIPWLLGQEYPPCDAERIVAVVKSLLVSSPSSFKSLQVMYPSYETCRSLISDRSSLEALVGLGWFMRPHRGNGWICVRK